MVRIDPALRVNNGDVMRDAAVAGLGIALLPTFLIAGARAAGTLEVIDVGARAAVDTVYVAYPTGRHPSAKVQALIARLERAFGDPPFWD